MDAAAMPFPSDETTPPVTKICLAIRNSGLDRGLPGANQFPNALQIARRIHSQRFVIGLDHADFVTVFERSQLFQSLLSLERPHRKTRVTHQKIPSVNI